jgi:hypothetical protein
LFRFALGRPEYRLGVELVELEKAGIDKVDDEAEEVNSKQRRESNAFLEDCLFLSLYFMGIQVCLIPMIYECILHMLCHTDIFRFASFAWDSSRSGLSLVAIRSEEALVQNTFSKTPNS